MSPPPGPATVAIERFDPGRWRELRAIRLEMLDDTPTAFLERAADARALDDAAWRRRAAGLATPGRSAAFWGQAGGAPVGFVAARAQDGPLALIHAMYVGPAHRGGRPSLASRLLDAAKSWATAEAGREGACLWVLDGNRPARRCYERAGFAPTGATRPYALDPAVGDEIEMEWRAGPLGLPRERGVDGAAS